jgi:hypothetical protein
LTLQLPPLLLQTLLLLSKNFSYGKQSLKAVLVSERLFLSS